MAVIIKGKNKLKPHTVRYWDQGRQRERSFRTTAEARAFMVKAEHDIMAGTFTDPKRGAVVFADYAAQWIAAKECAPSTRDNYGHLLSKDVAPHYGQRSLAQVAQDREALHGLLASMRDAGLSGSRRALAKALVTSVITEAQSAGRIGSHRLAGISVQRASVQPAVIIPATTAQLGTLAAGMRPGLGLVIWLCRGAGLRISEALAVRFDAFRDGGRVLRVSEQAGPGGTFGPLKHRRQGPHRDVPVPAWLWGKVQAHMEEFGTHDGYLFGGTGASYEALIVRFRAAAAKAGLPGLRPHGLRHLYASSLLTNGVPMSEVSKFLGHADFNVTHQTYSHLVPASWDRARDVLQAEFTLGLRAVA